MKRETERRRTTLLRDGIFGIYSDYITHTQQDRPDCYTTKMYRNERERKK